MNKIVFATLVLIAALVFYDIFCRSSSQQAPTAFATTTAYATHVAKKTTASQAADQRSETERQLNAHGLTLANTVKVSAKK